MELGDYLRILRNHWVGVLLIAALTTMAAASYSLSRPAVYAADATGFVTIGGTTVDAATASVGDSLAKSRATSYVDVATSRAVAQRVITSLQLDTTPAALIGSVSVKQPTDTVLLTITAKAATPKSAQDLADAWVTALAAEVEKIEDPSGKSSQVPKVLPVESAALPSSPVSPQPKRDTALGLLIGLLLGFGYAVVRNQLDRRLRSAAVIEKEFSTPVVGQIPAVKELDGAKGDGVAIDISSQAVTSIAGEAFRKLRTNLSYMDVDNPPRVILLTSPQQSDGKSTVAINLAAAVAAFGQPVTLIDADLRRSTIAMRLGIDGLVGLTDVLVGNVDLEEVMTEVPGTPGLRILPAGAIPPNPSELLGSQAMASLLAKLGSDGLVLIDAPPLLPVTDAAVLSRYCDGTLVVISAGRTLDQELQDALGHLQRVNSRVLGVVLNRIRRGGTDGYYYYRNGYYRQDKVAVSPKRPKAESSSGGSSSRSSSSGRRSGYRSRSRRRYRRYRRMLRR